MVRVVRLERTVSWSQTRRDTNFAIPGYSISAMIPRRRGKSKIFLSVVIPVVKSAFVPLSAIGENPANAGVARLCGVSPHPIPDTTTAPPKLFYNHELIEQYNLSLTSEDPFIKFIGYYHILEYFFDAVYTDELINSVKDIILHPGFSTKKPKEINKIIDTVRKKTRANQDAFQGTELEALELTIKRFVSLEQLHEDLANYRPDLIAYYKSHEISFSNGDAIDLDNYTSDKLPKKIAARIYKTRNALVHHKSNTARLKERGIYHPFKDEAELSNEIPLMRFVAEAIIIKTATEI